MKTIRIIETGYREKMNKKKITTIGTLGRAHASTFKGRRGIALELSPFTDQWFVHVYLEPWHLRWPSSAAWERVAPDSFGLNTPGRKCKQSGRRKPKAHQAQKVIPCEVSCKRCKLCNTMSNGAESRLSEDGLKKYQYLFQFLHKNEHERSCLVVQPSCLPHY